MKETFQLPCVLSALIMFRMEPWKVAGDSVASQFGLRVLLYGVYLARPRDFALETELRCPAPE